MVAAVTAVRVVTAVTVVTAVKIVTAVTRTAVVEQHCSYLLSRHVDLEDPFELLPEVVWAHVTSFEGPQTDIITVMTVMTVITVIRMLSLRGRCVCW